jgi:replicative DNA helicase
MMPDNDKGRSAASRQEEVASMSRMMKIMAKELNCPVILLSQMSRNVENRSDRKPKLSDLRESGSIEQDADIVMFLYREVEDDKENSPVVLSVAKHRNGELKDIRLKWQANICDLRSGRPVQAQNCQSGPHKPAGEEESDE